MSRTSQQEALALRRRELRAQIDQRRQAARATLEVRRQEAAAALAQRRAAQPKKTQERRWWLLVLLLLLVLLALLPDCSCNRAPAAGGAPIPSAASGPSSATPPPEALPPAGRIARTTRPSYRVAPQDDLPWLGAFRLQVAARSPRLAACFVGAARPGTLKWTASVEPTHGVVSDHSLEPTLTSDALSQEQRACALGVLSDPPYTLAAGDPRATPSRVGIAIEF